MAAMNANPSPLQIFRAGRHVAMSGEAIEFSDADLQACVAAYDPARHEAPIVVGHPRDNSPAYGWVGALSFADGMIEASPRDVDLEFAELVRARRYAKISASFYSPGSPSNPVPGVYYLRHVGFLGAQPPAVKGLRAPEFADGESGIVEFSEWGDALSAGLWRRLREWIIGRFGVDEADKVVPGYTVESIEDDARRPAPEAVTSAPAPAFSEPQPQPQPKENTVSPEQAAALEAENASLKQQVADAAAREKAAISAARHEEHSAFAEQLVQGARLPAAQRTAVVSLMDRLADDESVIEFGEGGDKQSKAPLAAFREFLSALPPVVEFGEIARREGRGEVDFSDPVSIQRAAEQYMAEEKQAGRNVRYDVAVQHIVSKKGV